MKVLSTSSKRGSLLDVACRSACAMASDVDNLAA